jgi:PAS domain S-box-containing protein
VDKTYKIIILEKDPADAELIDHQLKKIGLKHSAIRVGSKEIFLNTVRDFPPDLVVANMAVPRFDILAALGQSKELTPGAPWIVIAATATEEQAIGCMRAGAADFITKKTLSRLGASAKDLLEKRSQLEPKIEPEKKKEPEHPADPHERLFRKIVEHAPDLIAVVNLDGRRDYNSPAYAGILDDPETLLGTDSFVDIHPDDRERIKAIFQDIVSTGTGRETEYRLMDKDGRTRFINSHSSIIPGPDGNPQKVVVVSRDITAQVAAREMFDTLVAATAGVTGEQFFHILVRQLAEALEVRSVLVTRVASEDRTRVRSLAYWAEGALQPPLEYDVAGTPCEEIVKNGTTSCFPDSIQHPFALSSALGAINAESYLGTPLPGSEGHPVGHLVLIDDKAMTDVPRKEFILRVFAHRAALELFRASSVDETMTRDVVTKNVEARFRTALEGLPDPALMTDENDVITLVNPPLERLTGFRAQQLLGRRSWPLVMQSGAWQLLKEEYPDVVSRADKTSVPVTVYAIPCRNAEGRISGTLAILRPKITEQSIAAVPGGTESHEENLWLEQLGAAVIVRTLDDRIAYWNVEAERLYGWTEEEAIGKPLGEILQMKSPDDLNSLVQMTLEKGEWRGECHHYSKSGREVQVESRWSVVRTPEGSPHSIVIVSSDLQQRRTREMYVARRERLEGVVSLADAISHDFQELSAPILLASESLAARPVNEQTQRLAEVISHRMRRIDDLVKQVTLLTIRPEGGLPGTGLPQGRAEMVMIFDPEVSVRTLLEITLEANGYRTIPADDTEQGVALFSQHGERIKTVLLQPDMMDIEGMPLDKILRGINPNVTLIATSKPERGGAEGDEPLYAATLQRPFSPANLLESLDRVLHPA